MGILTVTLNPALDREIIIPDFGANKLHRVFDRENMSMTPGGKGINVSTMLNDWGIDNMATGFLGGYVGRIIQEEIQKHYKHVTTSCIRVSEDSRENITIVDEQNHTITEINAAGPTIVEDDINHFMKMFKSLVSKSRTLLVSGSVPFGIPLDAYATLTYIAHKTSTEVYMESRGKLLTHAVNNACPDIVRPDLRSDKKILGKEVATLEEFIEVGREIIEKGAKLVILSYQTANDIVLTQEGIWMYSVENETIDPSHLFGTGDAFMAAMIYFERKRQGDLKERAKFGMAAALAKTRYVKKQTPSIAEIEEALSKIKVVKIS